MHRVGAVTVGALAVLALVTGCSTSKKTAGVAATPTTAATTATTVTAAATASTGQIRTEYLAAIAPVDSLRDQYEASKGTPARASIATPFAASLRTFDAVVAKWPTSGRTETDLQTMISYDQLVASEVSANDLTQANVNRDDAAHATVRADLGLPPA
jgi:hypothetical protein